MIWLIGNNGMLGSEVEFLLKRNSFTYFTSDIEIDITDINCLESYSEGKNLNWIINCAAYTAVDQAENDLEKAFAINATGVYNIALIAKKRQAKLVHISTDYVFDGRKKGAYFEEDKTNPLGIYGKSKLKGEEIIRETIEEYYIIRTAWLYGYYGRNFVTTMLKLFQEKSVIRVVNDQWGSPTYTSDLGKMIIHLITSEKNIYGTYHYTNEGNITWFQFACEIFNIAHKLNILRNKIEIVPILSSEYPTNAQRPKNSYLSKNKISQQLGIYCRDWKEPLVEYLRLLYL